MNCLDFRRAAGADPQHLSDEALRHRDACPQCAGFLKSVERLDATIFKALQVPVESRPALPEATQTRIAEAVKASVGNRRRWYALAASIAGGVAVGALLWASGSNDALARDAIEHTRHEASVMVTSHIPVAAAEMRAVLDRDRVRLRSDPGLVSYVMSCQFRGHTVPHLVVQTSSGPVTVLVLRDEKVKRTVRFHEQGYAGTLVRSGPGGLALVGATDEQVAEAVERVEAALEWGE
jgi:hypothetical protein